MLMFFFIWYKLKKDLHEYIVFIDNKKMKFRVITGFSVLKCIYKLQIYFYILPY